jgi:hypothetical protein
MYSHLGEVTYLSGVESHPVKAEIINALKKQALLLVLRIKPCDLFRFRINFLS